jgi:uncharacterized coiled-coil protein SlyX
MPVGPCGVAHADEVTLEDLHEILVRQQKVIEEQGRKIETLQRELEDVKGAPIATVPAPLPADAGTVVPLGPADADETTRDAAVDALPPPSTAPPAPTTDGAATQAERIARALERFSVSSYGVVTYSHYDWETDSELRDDIDFERVVLGVAYQATDNIKLEAEIEIEHLGTGSTMEFDQFEEFGEFETEIERGGEVELEEVVIEYEPYEWLGVKVGYFPIPIGFNSIRHRPSQYFATSRFESEIALLPDTWTEAGVELFGTSPIPSIGGLELGKIQYKLAGVNGLDSTGFSSANWVKNGHQTRFEEINAEDWAVVARLDYLPIDGALLGTSVYYGDSSDNRPKPDLTVDADVTIWDIHGEYKRGLVEARAQYLRGYLENAAAVSLANAQLSNNLNVKRTPVGEESYAAFVEAGFHIDALTRYWPDGVIPFYRYDKYDSMDRVEAPVIRNPFYERESHTVGFNYRYRDWFVLKGEYSHRERDVSTNNVEETVSIGLGYDFGH